MRNLVQMIRCWRKSGEGLMVLLWPRRWASYGRHRLLGSTMNTIKGVVPHNRVVKEHRATAAALGPLMHSREDERKAAMEERGNLSKNAEREQETLMPRMMLHLQHMQSPAMQHIFREWTKGALVEEMHYHEHWKFSTRGVYSQGCVVFPKVGVKLRGRFWGSSYEQDLDSYSIEEKDSVLEAHYSKWVFNPKKHLGFSKPWKNLPDDLHQKDVERLWEDDTWMEKDQWHIAESGEPFECLIYDMEGRDDLEGLYVLEDEEELLRFPLYSKYTDCFSDDSYIQWPDLVHMTELMARLMQVSDSWDIPNFDPHSQHINLPSPTLVWYFVRLLFPQQAVCQRMLSGPISDDFNMTPLSVGIALQEWDRSSRQYQELHSRQDGIRAHEFFELRDAYQHVDRAMRRFFCMRQIPPVMPGMDTRSVAGSSEAREADREFLLDDQEVMPEVERKPQLLDGRVLVYPREFSTVLGNGPWRRRTRQQEHDSGDDDENGEQEQQGREREM